MNASNRIITSMVVNSVLAIVLVGILFSELNKLHKNYEFGLPMSEYLALKGNEVSKQEPPKTIVKTDTIQGEYKPKVAPKKGEPIPSSGAPIVKPKTQPKTTADNYSTAKQRRFLAHYVDKWQKTTRQFLSRDVIYVACRCIRRRALQPSGDFQIQHGRRCFA
jgi:hypothetical protein